MVLCEQVIILKWMSCVIVNVTEDKGLIDIENG